MDVDRSGASLTNSGIGAVVSSLSLVKVSNTEKSLGMKIADAADAARSERRVPEVRIIGKFKDRWY